MSTSGTRTFNPTIATIIDEAWERCGIDPSMVEVRRTMSARRSLNLLLTSELSADHINLWTVSETSTTPAESASTITLAAGAIDVLEALTRDSDGNDVVMTPISRAEWHAIPDKDQEGRPDRYWVDRTISSKTFHFWPAQDDQGYAIRMNVLYRIEDTGDIDNEAGIDGLWIDVVCAGLAKRLAEKWAPDRMPLLEAKFAQAYLLARRSNRERASLVISPSYR